MENITEYVDQVLSKLEGIHSDVVYDFKFISKYKAEGFSYVKDNKWITRGDVRTHIEVPTDEAPTGYVYKQVVCHIYVIDFKGVKYYGVDIDTYKGLPNIAVLFNKSIPETKGGIKWTKSVDNIKTYITYILEKYNKSYSLNNIPLFTEDILLYFYFTDEILDANLDTIKSLVNEYYKNEWIKAKKSYIDYEISQKEEHIKELEKEISRINSEIDNTKANINDLKKSKIQLKVQ